MAAAAPVAALVSASSPVGSGRGGTSPPPKRRSWVRRWFASRGSAV